jgi:acyl-coenzyme A synthetase/AMP-(fatty) acid ligase
MPGAEHPRPLRSLFISTNVFLIVPLALAAPAAAAGLAYFNAKTAFGYDVRLIGSVFKGQIATAIRGKKDKLNIFYRLEDLALGKQANDVFIIFEGRQWTYKEFYQTVLKYGTWIKNTYNVKPKEIVAMDFMNSEKFMFLWFGLWSIGAKPAFINYNLAEKALAHCIKVSTTRLTLIDVQIAEKFTQELCDGQPEVQFVVLTPEIEAQIMSTEGVREEDSTRSEDLPSNMAALIYTSGTTGLPKPAIVSWTKVQVGSILAGSWATIKRKDIFYTVRSLGFHNINANS